MSTGCVTLMLMTVASSLFSEQLYPVCSLPWPHCQSTRSQHLKASKSHPELELASTDSDKSTAEWRLPPDFFSHSFTAPLKFFLFPQSGE